ncbi:choice-of-anchor A family protein [Thalassotalea sp. LPB0316]|uniref:choice-of-anchor A family protein n=1 Tax=Thalassotalea sp. LPB0316 TaxID=2769490 RepID=UPI001865D9A9|nr:choice-of-anchor A family protein [Thalassotalea sp. LPB0316]QOL25224.1 choice-of-anchor A family protein [Thalassotalea sp. LPB0316]
MAWWRVVLVVFLGMSSVSQAGIIDLGEYNLVVRENFEVTSSDTQGRSAIGGDLIVNGQYNLGTLINDQVDNLQVVAGNIIKTQPNKNLHVQGVVEYSGQLLNDDNDTNGSLNGQFVEVDSPSIDFEQMFAEYNALSQALGLIEPTGSFSNPWASRVEFQADTNAGQALQVFNIQASELQGINEIAFSNNTNGQQVVINIFGDLDYNVGNIVNWNIVDSDVLLHFVDATTINLNSSVHASIFAPGADIFASAGEVKGQIIANSWSALSPTQINYDLFTNVEYIEPSTQVEVSEPQTLLIWIVSLAFLLFARKKIAINTVNEDRV